MFEHLDDPEAAEPGRLELTQVLTRAHGIRARRRWALALATCGVMLAASVGFFLARPAGPPPSTVSDYQFNLATNPLPLGSSVPATALVDIQFATAQDGFALAVHRGQVLLAATEDGGSSWQVRNTGLPQGLGAADNYPGQMEFVGFTGYLWGARTAAGSPLWVTHDEGATWQRASIGPDVLDVSAIDLDVWALVATCLDGQLTGPCRVDVEQSPDGGTSWQDLGPVASTTGPDTGIVTRLELARITKERSYVLSNLGSPAQPAWYLAFTGDSGASWTTRPVPCTGTDATAAEVAASSTDDLWLLCGGTAAAGAQEKQLYRSGDGGVTWRLAASSSTAAAALPVAGYAPFGPGHRDLAVASATTAWLYPTRADLYKTTDGGTSWDPAPDLADAGFPNGGEGNVTFISATQGWICAYGVGLWHTTDGTHWEPLGVS
jgi:photosystem II stability/assembly factor-like uncharacterized protein